VVATGGSALEAPAHDPRGEASGHLRLVLLHAGVLDPRLKHVTVDLTLASYRALLQEPMPLEAPEAQKRVRDERTA
jgi:hypothetical protein